MNSKHRDLSLVSTLVKHLFGHVVACIEVLYLDFTEDLNVTVESRFYWHNNNNNKSIYIAPSIEVTLFKGAVTRNHRKKLKIKKSLKHGIKYRNKLS